MGNELISALSPDQSHQLELEIKQILSHMTTQAFTIGEKIHTFYYGRGWLGLGYDTFPQWIASIGLKLRSAYNFMKLHKLWLTKFNALPVEHQSILLQTPYSKILALTKSFTETDDPEKIAELIHTAFTLSRSDLKKFNKTNDGEDEVVEYYQCPDCGKDLWVCDNCKKKVRIKK